MRLNSSGIFDLVTWKELAPPKGGDKQWKEGRSAMELARYMTTWYPAVPKELESVLTRFTELSAVFDWHAEYITNFNYYGLGRGEGRNHDAFLYNSDVVVGIEAKADESLGAQVLGEEIKTASENKRYRINEMIHMLFGDAPENHDKLRYQLVTASSAMLLEAKERNVKNAILFVVVFKKKGCYSEKKIQQNNADIGFFLEDIAAELQGDCYFIPTHYGKDNGINLYFKKIEILLD